VEFKTKEEAEKAIEEYNNKDFQGRPLQIREVRKLMVDRLVQV